MPGGCAARDDRAHSGIAITAPVVSAEVHTKCQKSPTHRVSKETYAPSVKRDRKVDLEKVTSKDLVKEQKSSKRDRKVDLEKVT